MEFNFRNHTIRWLMSKSTNVFHILLGSSYRFRDFQIFYIGPSKSRSRSRSAIFAITLFDGKCQNLRMLSENICASSYRFRDITFFNLLPPKGISRSRSAFSQLHHSMANVKIYKSFAHIFAQCLTVSKI